MEEKQIVFISDLHFGDPRFDKRKKEMFADFLQNYVRPYAAKLIIAGDLFETVRHSAQYIMGEYRDMLTRLWEVQLGGVNITYVVGNHDLFFADFCIDGKMLSLGNIGIAYPYYDFCWQYGGKSYRFLVEHGHLQQRDYLKYAKVYNAFTRMGKVVGMLGPKACNAAEDLMDWLEYFKKRLSRTLKTTSEKDGEELLQDLDDCRKAAIAKIKDGLDFVLMGHTHLPQHILLDNGRAYINTGDWVKHSTYSYFDKGMVYQGEWS